MGCTCLPELVPWQRRQFSYWLMAGVSTLVPSLGLMPIAFFCEARIRGADGKICTGCDPCGPRESTQVAWRAGLRRPASGWGGMGTGGRFGQGVGLPAQGAGGIVASQTQLPAGTVLDEKVLRYQVLGLHVGIVAGGALDASVDELDGAGGIGGFARSDQR